MPVPRPPLETQSQIVGGKTQLQIVGGKEQSAGKSCENNNPQRLQVRKNMKLDAQWIVGFIDGEGCFHIGINKNTEMKIGYQVLPEFVVTQHKRSVQVLHGLKDYFKSGVIRNSKGKGNDILSFRIRNRHDLITTIIPFFEKHKLKTTKRFDFIKFRRVLLCMENREHLTSEGLDKIRKIRDRQFNLNLLQNSST